MLTQSSDSCSYAGLTSTACSTPTCKSRVKKKCHRYSEYNKLKNISHFILTEMQENLFFYTVTFMHIYVTTTNIWTTYHQWFDCNWQMTMQLTCIFETKQGWFRNEHYLKKPDLVLSVCISTSFPNIPGGIVRIIHFKSVLHQIQHLLIPTGIYCQIRKCECVNRSFYKKLIHTAYWILFEVQGNIRTCSWYQIHILCGSGYASC